MKKSIIGVLVCLLASSTFAQDTPKQPEPVGPGDDHTRTLMMGDQKRTYLVQPLPPATPLAVPKPELSATPSASSQTHFWPRPVCSGKSSTTRFGPRPWTNYG